MTMGWGSFLSDFLGSDDRAQARELADEAQADRDTARQYSDRQLGIAEESRTAQQEFLDSEQSRYDSIYAPLEQGIADKLGQGPALEEQAGIAANDYGNQFDASIAARDRAQQRQGVSYRPGSSTARMQSDNDAYERAKGVATAQTTARREEDDRHFLQSTAFYNQNGSGVRSQLLSGMQQMYGADYSAYGNASNQMLDYADINQNNSNALNEQSYDGINTAIRGGVALATGGGSEIAGGIKSLFS